MAYTHFQFIAYQVPTVAIRTVNGAKEVLYGIPPGTVTNAPQLSGNSSQTLDPDARTRVERLINVLLTAAANRNIDSRDSTLKVFVVPEFYFRQNNHLLSYTYDQYQSIKEALKQTILSNITYFKHWIIIPGTIMWRLSNLQTAGRRENRSGGSVFFNSCPYIYADATTVTSHVLEKAAASRIDGLPTGNHGNTPVTVSNGNAAPDVFWRYQESEKIKKHLFKINGLSIGIEICLEHGIGLLKNTVKNEKKLLSRINTYRPHIQIVTAGGMPVVPSKTVAKINGYIVRNDGYIPDPTKSAYTMKKITGFERVDSRNSAIMNDLTRTSRPTIIDILPANTDFYLAPPANWTAQEFAPLQKIVISHRQRLP